MTDQGLAHRVALEMDEAVASDVPVRSDMTLKVRRSCACGCDLSGAAIRLMSGEAMLASSETAEFAIAAPDKAGSWSWVVLFPRQEIGGVVHEGVSLPVTFTTRALMSSLAIWDVPSPVVIGGRFTIKIGAKSSASCELKGAKVEVLDDAGTLVGRGQLGDVSWEGTAALYWTEVELPAPPDEGIVSWSARFAPADLELPHDEAVACFSFAAVRPPDHRLTITFVEKETEKPIENAHIRLGPFRALTDAGGAAQLSMPKGTYEIKVWHAGYEAPPTTVDIIDDVTLRLVGVAVPEEDPSARFMM